MSKGSRVGMMNAFGAATGTISMLVLLTGSGSAVVGAPAEFQLTAASAPSGADVSTTVPPSETVFNVGESLFVEVWVQSTDENGLSSVSLDLSFNGSVITGVGITHSSVFSQLTHGTIDNAGGQVDDLSGSHLGPCSDAVGVAPNWARVAVVEFSADLNGVSRIEGSATGSGVYGTSICGVGDIDPGNIIFDSVTVTVGDTTVPAASTWGLAAMTLLVLMAGTVVLRRRQRDCGSKIR